MSEYAYIYTVNIYGHRSLVMHICAYTAINYLLLGA